MEGFTVSADTQLCYVSPTLLGPGTIVPPGNFGKKVLSYSPARGNNPWMLVRELIYEQVRFQMTPHLPSRLHCNFLFLNVAAAMEAIKTKELANEVLSPSIYIVELLDPSLPHCKAEFDRIKATDDNRFVDSVLEAAGQYWNGANTGQLQERCLPELLTLSPFRIVHDITHTNRHPLLFPVIKAGHATGS